MMSRDRFRHDRSTYERPTLGWTCGRAAAWGTPCAHGPSASGACGGVAACNPAQRGGAWTCRRPAAQGGPCASGPGAHGECGVTQPPCTPRRTLSVWRGRFAVLAVGIVLALIALFSSGADMRGPAISSIEPGPLSAAHAHFAAEAGCGACHQAHEQGAAGWWRAFWTPVAARVTAANSPGAVHKLSDACVDCHGFGGKETLAHNAVFEKRSDLSATDCLSCHTEHRGAIAPVSTITEAQCQTCHTVKVHDFAKDHPPFPAGFPYDHAKSLKFDHANHIAKYFDDPKVVKFAPQGGCVGCHEVRDGARAIRPASFEAMCANCHQDSIARNDFVLFRWPEIEKNEIPAAAVEQACGVSGEALKSLRAALDAALRGQKPADRKDEDFSAISLDEPTAMTAYLLGVPSDDVTEFSSPVQKLLAAMMTDGVGPLADAAREKLPGADVDRMFAGFNAEQARQAGCAWAANREYEAPSPTAMAGWRADALDLRYSKPAHADPALRAWIEAVVGLQPPADADDRSRWSEAKRALMSPSEGPGLCFKCHTASGSADGAQKVEWKITLGAANPHTRFDHRPHVDLLGPEKTCVSCHSLNTAATIPAASSAFKAITLATCTDCHAATKVRDDCQLCHVYHQDPALMRRMMSDAK